MIKKSVYTIIKKFNDGVLLFNTRNGVQVFIKNDNIELLEDVTNINENNCSIIKSPLLKQFFCVEKNVDELSMVLTNYYKQLFDPTNLSMIIMPNNICNFDCVYCYQNHDKRVMSDTNVDNFIDSIKNYHRNHKLKNFYLEWFGGEPFLSYIIIEKITNELSDYFDKNSIAYHYGATTNGYLLTEERIDFLLSHRFDYFQITIDGCRDNHNKYRHLIGGNGTWDTIINNLEVLSKKKDYDFHVAIRVNYNKETINNIDELFYTIKTKLDDRFTVFFHTIGKWGGKNDDQFDTIDSSLEPFVTLQLIEKASKFGIEARTNFSFCNPFCRICYAGMPYHFTIGSDGLIRKCNEEDEIIDKFNVIGTIENKEIEFDIDKWAKYILPGGSYQLPRKCKKCQYLPVCYAQNCPKARIINKGKNICPSGIESVPDLLYQKLLFKRKKGLDNV